MRDKSAVCTIILVLITNICLAQLMVNVKNYGAKGNGISDDTRAVARAISSGAANVFFPKGRYIISATLSLRSNICLYGEGAASILIANKTTELFKAFNSATYNDISFKNLTLTSDKKRGDQKLRVLMQLYNVNQVLVESCGFEYASAAVGLQNCRNVILRGNTIKGMYEQPLNSSSYPGNYGYGFVLNECEDVLVRNNILGQSGTKAYIERHALYISNSKTPQARNSKRIQVTGNQLYMRHYTNDKEPVTGFEFAIKCIGGEDISIANNTISGGVGGFILSLTSLNARNIVLENNKFYELLKSGVKITCEEAQCPALVENITIRSNRFMVTGTYGLGVIAKNFKTLNISGNSFFNQVKDVSMPSTAYYIYSIEEGANYQAGKLNARDNNINGFTQLGNLGSLASFSCNDAFTTPGLNISAATLIRKTKNVATSVMLNKKLLN